MPTVAAGGADLSAAVFAYNHSASYVTQVLALAQSYGRRRSGGRRRAGAAAIAAAGPEAGQVAVAWALAQVGTPYVWGGETPGVGFDCSGLTQAAYRAAGVALPRVAQDQFDAGPELGSGTLLEPGDLVFFGGGPGSVSHVGLYVGVRNGKAMMVDAPHIGRRRAGRGVPAHHRRQLGQRPGRGLHPAGMSRLTASRSAPGPTSGCRSAVARTSAAGDRVVRRPRAAPPRRERCRAGG